MKTLNRVLNDKRPELINRKVVIFQQDNCRPHTSLVTREKLRELAWDLLMHTQYSPDLGPLDYYCFSLCRTS